eukprot:scaffold28520_cov124-Isochrysis_galbana.AAC.2
MKASTTSTGGVPVRTSAERKKIAKPPNCMASEARAMAVQPHAATAAAALHERSARGPGKLCGMLAVEALFAVPRQASSEVASLRGSACPSNDEVRPTDTLRSMRTSLVRQPSCTATILSDNVRPPTGISWLSRIIIGRMKSAHTDLTPTLHVNEIKCLRGRLWALERKRLGARQPVDSTWELRRLRRPGERGAEGEPTWAG